MNIDLYLAKIPKIEGTTYEYDVNAYRKFGLDIGDFSQVGYTVSESELKDMKWGDPRIKAALKRYWDVFQGDNLPQLIAEQLTDHAFNKGIGTTICMAQTMLRDRYNVPLAVDGKWGNITTGAMTAIVKKYGVTHVYNSLYAYRWNYYNGVAIPDSIGCKNIVCTREICKSIANSRLNRYYPPQFGYTNAKEWTSRLPVTTVFTDTVVNSKGMATSALQPPSTTNKVVGIVTASFIVVALVMFIYQKLKQK